MRILHLSDQVLQGGIISWRIEKSAVSALRRGYEVFFGGPKKSISTKETFTKLYEINWTPSARRGFPYDWHCVKKQVHKVLTDVRPDIIHANNIFSAKMISEFDYPFVYDDHEFWSTYVKRQIESYNSRKNNVNNNNDNGLRKIIRSLAMRFLNSNFLRLGIKWEKELVSSTPTITVSNNIAQDLMELGNTKKVFVTPNYPLIEETKDIPHPYPRNELSCVYAGIDGKSMPHRDIEGFVDRFSKRDLGNLTLMGIEDTNDNQRLNPRVRYTGFLPRTKMYEEMKNHCVGLIPFKKHWSHKFISPNKAYEYAHAGLFVMCTSSLVTISDILKENCITFDNYDEMALQLANFKNNPDELYDKRIKISRFAKSNLIWENHEKKIFNAYQVC